MEDKDRQEIAHRGFLLGVRATLEIWDIGRERPHGDDRFERLWDLVNEIAEGRRTLFSTPAELTAPHPDMNADLREFIFSHMNEFLQEERETAKLVRKSEDDFLRS